MVWAATARTVIVVLAALPSSPMMHNLMVASAFVAHRSPRALRSSSTSSTSSTSTTALPRDALRHFLRRPSPSSSSSSSRGRFFSTTTSAATTMSAAAAATEAASLLSQRPYYITTPIYYVNDKPHIGHAYTTLACDALARWYRMEGRPVYFLTGTDEHGQKVQQSAQKAGVTPQEYVDDLSESFRDLLEVMGFSNDGFIRTTSSQHKEVVAALWRRLEERGQLYLGAYEGWYSVRDECYYTESELVDGKAPTGAEVEWVVKEQSYFFKLSEWEQPLLDYYEAHPDFIGPQSRRNEVISFVKGGLRDLSISRTAFDWGVPVPEPTTDAIRASIEEGGDSDTAHVMYVWVDALANYLSAIGWPNGDLYKKFWEAPKGGGGSDDVDATESGGGEVVHLVGKDILRFHAVYWPALLMAAGITPPARLFAHGWWTRDGAKISKSVGNVIDPKDLVETFGVDQVRYFLLSEVPFGQDGDYSEQAMLACANGFLANALGNLQMRVLSLIFKNCEGAMPQPCPGESDGGEADGYSNAELTADDEALLLEARELRSKIAPLMATQQLHKACGVVDACVRSANKYIDEQAPWALKKTDLARMGTTLWVLAETLRHVAIVASPFMPSASTAMLDQLAVPEDERSLGNLTPPEAVPGGDQRSTADSLAAIQFSVKPGTAILKPTGVFPRIELDDGTDAAAAAAAPPKGGQKKGNKAPKKKKEKESKTAA